MKGHVYYEQADDLFVFRPPTGRQFTARQLLSEAGIDSHSEVSVDVRNGEVIIRTPEVAAAAETSATTPDATTDT